MPIDFDGIEVYDQLCELESKCLPFFVHVYYPCCFSSVSSNLQSVCAKLVQEEKILNFY